MENKLLGLWNMKTGLQLRRFPECGFALLIAPQSKDLWHSLVLLGRTDSPPTVLEVTASSKQQISSALQRCSHAQLCLLWAHCTYSWLQLITPRLPVSLTPFGGLTQSVPLSPQSPSFGPWHHREKSLLGFSLSLKQAPWPYLLGSNNLKEICHSLQLFFPARVIVHCWEPFILCLGRGLQKQDGGIESKSLLRK